MALSEFTKRALNEEEKGNNQQDTTGGLSGGGDMSPFTRSAAFQLQESENTNNLVDDEQQQQDAGPTFDMPEDPLTESIEDAAKRPRREDIDTSPDIGTDTPDMGTTSPDTGTTTPNIGTTSPNVGTTTPGTQQKNKKDIRPLANITSDGTAEMRPGPRAVTAESSTQASIGEDEPSTIGRLQETAEQSAEQIQDIPGDVDESLGGVPGDLASIVKEAGEYLDPTKEAEYRLAGGDETEKFPVGGKLLEGAINLPSRALENIDELDPTEGITYRTAFSEESQELPVGGELLRGAINVPSRIWEELSLRSLQVAGGYKPVKKSFQSLVTGEEFTPSELLDTSIEIDEAEDRLNLDSQFGVYETGEGEKVVPSAGQVMVDSFERYEKQNPGDTTRNILKAVGVGPGVTSMEMLFASLDLQDAARLGVRATTNSPRAQRGLRKLGIDQTEEVTVGKIKSRFEEKANRIIDNEFVDEQGARRARTDSGTTDVQARDEAGTSQGSRSGSEQNQSGLTYAGQVALNELGQATQDVIGQLEGGGIMQLNDFGNFVQNTSRMLLTDLTDGGFSLRETPEIAPKPGLPGTRERPGQGPAAGLSTREVEDVGRGPTPEGDEGGQASRAGQAGRTGGDGLDDIETPETDFGRTPQSSLIQNVGENIDRDELRAALEDDSDADLPDGVEDDELIELAGGQTQRDFQVGITSVQGAEPRAADELVRQARRLEQEGAFDAAGIIFDKSLVESGGLEGVARRFLDNTGVGIETLRPSTRRFSGGAEPTIYSEFSVSDTRTDEFKREIVDLADKEFDQESVMITEEIADDADTNLGITNRERGESIEPAADFVFDNELTPSQVQRVDAIMEEAGINGSTIGPDNQRLEVTNVSKFNKDYDQFSGQIRQLDRQIRQDPELGSIYDGVEGKNVRLSHYGKTEEDALATYEQARSAFPPPSQQRRGESVTGREEGRLLTAGTENFPRGTTIQDVYDVNVEDLTPREVGLVKRELFLLENEIMNHSGQQISRYVMDDGTLPDPEKSMAEQGIEENTRQAEFVEDSEEVLERNGFASIENAQQSIDDFGERMDQYNKFNDYVHQVNETHSLGPQKPGQARQYADGKEPSFEMPEETILGVTQRYIQDKAARLTTVQEAVEQQTDLNVTEDLDAYLKRELMVGRADERVKQFKNEAIDLFDRITNEFDFEEFTDFVYAKHAPERNKYVAELTDGEIPDGGSGMMTERAEQILDNVRERGDLERMEDFFQEFKEKVTKRRLDILEESGMIDSSTRSDLEDRFDNYVALKAATDYAEDASTGQGFSVESTGLKTITGSVMDKADRANPLIQSVADVQQTIILAEKNRVGQTLVDLINKAPNDDVWEVEGLQQIPSYDEAGELRTFNPNRSFADSELKVYRDGEAKLVTIHDEALQRAFINEGTSAATKVASKFSSFYTAIQTQLNPGFVVSNLQRDIQTALIQLSGDKGFRAGQKAAQNIPKAMAGIFREEFDEEISSFNSWLSNFDDVEDADATEMQEAYREMKMAGGKTGWMQVETVDQQFNQMMQKIGETQNMSRSQQLKQSIKEVGEFVEKMNRVAEQASRVAAHKALRDEGMSVERSAQFAKNITINFNKKGEWSAALNALYVFSSPAIQGNVRALQSMMRSKRMWGIMAAIVATGFGLAEVNKRINPEAWKDTRDQTKNGNFVLSLPPGIGDDTGADVVNNTPFVSMDKRGDESYNLTLNAPYIYNVLLTMGYESSDLIGGESTIGESGGNLLRSFDRGVLPIGGGSTEQVLSPTITDPIFQIAGNTTWYGGNIMPEQPPYRPNVPDSQRFYSSVSEESKAITKWLNRKTGGNRVKSGYVDVSPETVDFWSSWATGGTGQFVGNVIDSGVSFARGDMPDIDGLPFLDEMISQPAQDIESQRAFETLDQSETDVLSPREIDGAISNIEEARAEGQIDEETASRLIDDFETNVARQQAGEIIQKIEQGEDINVEEEINKLPEKTSDAIVDQITDIVETEIENMREEQTSN